MCNIEDDSDYASQTLVVNFINDVGDIWNDDMVDFELGKVTLWVA